MKLTLPFAEILLIFQNFKKTTTLKNNVYF